MICASRLCGAVAFLWAVSSAQSAHAEHQRSTSISGPVACLFSKGSRTIEAIDEKTLWDSTTNDLYVALNHLAIRYARGFGVSPNTKLAFTLFMSLAMDGYTPAMVNVGTLYESGLAGGRDRQLAYAWIRAALSLGVPEDNVDEAVYKLGFIAARLGSRKTAEAERAARRIALTIAEQITRSDNRNPDSAQCESPPRLEATTEPQSQFSPRLAGPRWDVSLRAHVSADSMLFAGSGHCGNRLPTSK